MSISPGGNIFTINLLLIPLMGIKTPVSNMAEALSPLEIKKKGGIMVYELT